jgi:transposase
MIRGREKNGARRINTQPGIWKPPVELSERVNQIMKKIHKAKLFLFLRQHRHILLDEAFQQELASLYRPTPAACNTSRKATPRQTALPIVSAPRGFLLE